MRGALALKTAFVSDRLIWWIVGLAVVIRLITIPIWGGDPENQKLFEYGQIAWNIVQGHGFSWDFEGRFPLQPTAYSPALYCYTLVPWFALFGLNLLGPRIMHALLLGAVCWFLYRIGESLANRRVGLLAALIWALYPEMFFLGLRLAPENAAFLAMTWLLLQAQKCQNAGISPRGKQYFGCGALLGFSCWVNPSFQILALVTPLSWKLFGNLRWKSVLLFWLGAILVISPWTIRNYVKLGAWVPLRTAFSYNMWRGNHVGATGTVRRLDGSNVDESLSPAYAAYVEAHMVPSEVERDRFFAGEVRKFIAEHPREYWHLTIKRLGYYWWRDATHPLTARLAYMGPWMLILAFSSVGLWSIRRHWRRWSLWWLQIIGFTMLFSLTIVLPRYRMPIYPAMFLLAAAGLNTMFEKLGIWRLPFQTEYNHDETEDLP